MIKLQIHKMRSEPINNKSVFKLIKGGDFNYEKFFDERQAVAWTLIEGELKLELSMRIKNKYPDYMVYKIPVPTHNWNVPNIVPCRAMVVVKGTTPDGSEFALRYGLSYETFVAFEPCKIFEPGMVLTKLEQKPLDGFNDNFKKIRTKKWIQLGSTSDKFIILLNLRRNPMEPPINPWTIKDDVTGEFYPYILYSAYLLEKTGD